VDLLPGVRARHVDTARLSTYVYESGPADGAPVVLVHGNLSTGRFFEHLMPRLPGHVIAPDMRSFGRSATAPLDATRGLADWADDVAALLDALGVTAPPHLLGWSTGGAAIASFASVRPVASLTFVDPVSPYGYGGTQPDGTPCYPDGAGTGGGSVNPELVARLRGGDRSADSPFAARSLYRAFYVRPGFLDPREDLLVDEILLTVPGDATYPGGSVASPHWPGFAPGTTGLINGLSPRYCDWSGVADLDPKPPVLWTHGSLDLVVADGSPLEVGTLGASGVIPGWPGEEAYPPQPMVDQIRAVLGRYAAAGGSVREEIIEGAAHGPFLDAEDTWLGIYTEFLAAAGAR
jgi:pimeloyl-ACP methyl ester carboxylesterase